MADKRHSDENSRIAGLRAIGAGIASFIKTPREGKDMDLLLLLIIVLVVLSIAGGALVNPFVLILLLLALVLFLGPYRGRGARL
jgi:hypothetical protein